MPLLIIGSVITPVKMHLEWRNLGNLSVFSVISCNQMKSNKLKSSVTFHSIQDEVSLCV